jgi:hypothetical protein
VRGRLELALEAQRFQYELELLGAKTETGRFGEVLADMGAHQSINQFFIPYIVEGLMETGRVEDAWEALAEYLRLAPRHAEAKKIQRLQKLVDRGTFKRRTQHPKP